MDNFDIKDEIEILKRHKEDGIKFISASSYSENLQTNLKNTSLSDFKQGDIGNCGLIAAVAAISQRSEFLSEIVPKIEQTSEGMKLHFKMFYKGNSITITIDDKLPCRLSEDVLSLVYAGTPQNNNISLASFFEKVVVQYACFNSYKNSVGINPQFVFSLFSDCMTSSRLWFKTDSKQHLMKHLKWEVDNESSVLMIIIPDLIYEPERDEDPSHAYVVMGYNSEHKAIKLFNPNHRKRNSCENLPLSITELADPNKGELWTTLDQLEKRAVFIESLYSKTMYKSVFQVKKEVKPSTFDKKYSKVIYSCKINAKEASTFMMNILSFTHEAYAIGICVITAGKEKRKVALNYELPPEFVSYPNQKKGEAKSIVYSRFKLQPNEYVFKIEVLFIKTNAEKVNLLLKIGSISESTFEEIP